MALENRVEIITDWPDAGYLNPKLGRASLQTWSRVVRAATKELLRHSTMIVALASGLTPTLSPVCAQVAEPSPIIGPVPDRWRGPFEEFLREFGVGDQKALIDKASAFQIGGVWHVDSIGFRIEASTTCHEDLCFTVIGHIIDNNFLADAMFAAGKRLMGSDQFLPLFGFQTLKILFVRGESDSRSTRNAKRVDYCFGNQLNRRPAQSDTLAPERLSG